MIGTRLAHYEITAHLGSGGMGDVYQATDSKLGRSVAIKVLPEAFIHDADRKARLEREARALASLNHPHIAAIHGLEESGGQSFLVMELAEGETLAERIARGALPVGEALAIAHQVAEGLEAAHEKGIVHRDLKPANIKISSDGRVKILDFGVAKAFQDEKAEVNRSNSPTLSLAATNAGVILGTAAYMSPEQAKGNAVDRRTDVFAFGCVLYEMFTGRPAFDGETVPEILARVLEREPDWNRLPAGLNPRIVEVLHRCFEKDPRKRRRDMGDVLLDLDSPLPTGEVAAPRARRVRVAWMTALALAALAVLSIAYTAYFRFNRSSSDAPEMRVEISTPSTSDPISFATSPDGRSLVFVAIGDGQPRLWLRPLDAVTAEVLAGTEGASYPF
jgi:eukaryotic-like serine/threonine-protein kinase